MKITKWTAEECLWQAIAAGGVMGGAPDDRDADEGAGGADDSSVEGDGAEGDKGAGDSKVAALEAQLAAAEAELGKHRDADAKRKADAKKKADNAEIEKGNAAAMLATKDAEIEALKASLAEVEKGHAARADAAFDALPDHVRDAIEPFREKMGAADWLDLVERQAKIHAPEGAPRVDTAPRVKPPDRSKGDDELPKLSDKAKQVIANERPMMNTKIYDDLAKMKDPRDYSQRTFVDSLQKFLGLMNKKQHTNLNTDNLAKRDSGQ